MFIPRRIGKRKISLSFSPFFNSRLPLSFVDADDVLLRFWDDGHGAGFGVGAPVRLLPLPRVNHLFLLRLQVLQTARNVTITGDLTDLRRCGRREVKRRKRKWKKERVEE